VEVVDEALEGVLWEIGTQHEALDGKPIEEELNPVSLHDVARMNDGLAFKDP